MNYLFKKHAKKILNINTLITPCFTNCYFSEEYLNCKYKFDLLSIHSEVKVPRRIPFCINFKDKIPMLPQFWVTHSSNKKVVSSLFLI